MPEGLYNTLSRLDKWKLFLNESNPKYQPVAQILNPLLENMVSEERKYEFVNSLVVNSTIITFLRYIAEEETYREFRFRYNYIYNKIKQVDKNMNFNITSYNLLSIDSFFILDEKMYYNLKYTLLFRSLIIQKTKDSPDDYSLTNKSESHNRDSKVKNKFLNRIKIKKGI